MRLIFGDEEWMDLCNAPVECCISSIESLHHKRLTTLFHHIHMIYWAIFKNLIFEALRSSPAWCHSSQYFLTIIKNREIINIVRSIFSIILGLYRKVMVTKLYLVMIY